jgi:hypothetical protein
MGKHIKSDDLLNTDLSNGLLNLRPAQLLSTI